MFLIFFSALFHKLTANIHLCTLCVTGNNIKISLVSSKITMMLTMIDTFYSDLNDVIHDNGEHYPVVYGIGITLTI